MTSILTFLENELGYLIGSSRKQWLAIDLTFAFIGGFYYWLSTKIELLIWENSHAFLTMVVLVILDFLTGVWYALQQGKFETKKALRGSFKLITYTVLLAVAFNLSKSDPLFAWLPSAVFVPMCVILLLSLIKNLSLLGFIDNKFAAVIYENIDKYKNKIENAENLPITDVVTIDNDSVLPAEDATKA